MKQYEPWVWPVLEETEKGTEVFPDPEKLYFRGLVQYAIDLGDQSEAEALAKLVSEIASYESADARDLARIIAKAFQKAGKEAIAQLITRR